MTALRMPDDTWLAIAWLYALDPWSAATQRLTTSLIHRSGLGPAYYKLLNGGALAHD